MRPLSAKQEAWARYSANGLDDSAAYRLAYDAANMLPATVNRCAHDLACNPKVAARVAELQARVVALADDSAADVLRDTRATYAAAQDAKQYGAAVAALTLRARRHPEFSDKRELSGPAGGPIPVAVMQFLATLAPEQLAKLASGEKL